MRFLSAGVPVFQKVDLRSMTGMEGAGEEGVTVLAEEDGFVAEAVENETQGSVRDPVGRRVRGMVVRDRSGWMVRVRERWKREVRDMLNAKEDICYVHTKKCNSTSDGRVRAENTVTQITVRLFPIACCSLHPKYVQY